jgi:uncharacterized membrane protein
MLEILFLVSVVLSIVALSKARSTARQLSETIDRFGREIEALKQARPVPGAVASEDLGAVAPSEEMSTEGNDVETAEASGPWAAARQGRAVFGEAGPAATGEAGSDDRQDGETGEAVEPIPQPVAARESLESRIGARWAVWVGGIALALGGVFMVKYSIEAGLLSPAVRLSLAALFSLVLVAGGEVIRRRSEPLVADAFQNAMIPGILTAAGALTLFGVTYVAYAFYGYLGPFTAFLLLAAIGLATTALSLLHGQALAGLGMLGALTTPMLVATDAPSASGLFGYLTITWLATLAAARLRRWQVVPVIGNAGLAAWALLYLTGADTVEVLPVTLSLAVMLAGIGLVWPGTVSKPDGFANAQGEAATADEPSDTDDQHDEPRRHAAAYVPSAWERLSAPPLMAVSLSAGLAAFFPAVVLASLVSGSDGAAYAFAALVLALAVLGGARVWAIYPAVLSAMAALAGTAIITATPATLLLQSFDPVAPPTFDSAVPLAAAALPAPVNLLLALAIGFAAAGALALYLHGRKAREFATVWSVLMVGVPLVVATTCFLVYGNLSFDLKHGLHALVLALALMAGAEIASRGEAARIKPYVPLWALVFGSFGFLVLALHALTDGLVTTLAVSVLGFLFVLALRLRRWPVLPWGMVAAAVVVGIRIAWEPTIVGAASLSTTPVFNQLLAGYGIPALLLALAAFELRTWRGVRVRYLVQALASLFLLLTAAILVRHAMNGGVLDSSVPTLGEQSIYTLLVIGASGIMMTLDLKSPSPVFRWGSMVVGVLSVASVLSAHFIGLNPYFTGELTGRIPFFNLLLIGYLLPGLAYAGLAWYARGRRPMPYVIMLALSGVALAFAWVTLSVRRYWQGESIADWKGFLEAETYTYSVVWLLLGVALLALGSRFDAKSVRLASAALVLIAVVKVFLIDMSNLEGILRALSFIGLGAVLIGIGLFYQKILTGKGGKVAA